LNFFSFQKSDKWKKIIKSQKYFVCVEIIFFGLKKKGKNSFKNETLELGSGCKNPIIYLFCVFEI
jgi:hypothetical protein